MGKIKLFTKAALTDWQIDSRYAVNPDLLGFEIHTNGFINDWGLAGKMRDVVSLHSPFEGFNHNMSVFLKNYRTDYWTDFIKESKKLNSGKGAGIVVHSDLPFDEFIVSDIDFYDFLRESGTIFYIENTMMASDTGDGARVPGTSMDVPDICTYVNDKVGFDVFYPLLDTCHAMSESQAMIANPEWSLEDHIRNYESDNYVIHLSVALGEGQNILNHHGSTFEGMPQLLDAILALLSDLSNDVNIVLEVNEAGHADGDIPFSYIKVLDEIKESCERTGVQIEGLN